MENTVETAIAITHTSTRLRFSVLPDIGIMKTPSWIHFGTVATTTESAKNATAYVKHSKLKKKMPKRNVKVNNSLSLFCVRNAARWCSGQA
jgi:hypothetical protein